MSASQKSFCSFLILLLSCFGATAQNSGAYQLRFIKAKAVEALNEREVVVLFEVCCTNSKAALPVICPVVKYRIGAELERTVNLTTDEDVRAVVYGKNIEEKAPLIYDYVKDKVNIKSADFREVLAFYVRVQPDDDFDKMSFACALSNNGNQKSGRERRFEFPVGQ